MNTILKGMRVVDLTRLLPGPYATLLLADFGAEIIKIEDTDMGDYLRGIPPMLTDNKGYLFEILNRNKKCISLNLKKEKGVELLYELIKKADIICESFRPGVTEKLKIDYDTLKKINPELIYCSITGYGQKSRMANLAGHDLNYLSFAGFFSNTKKESIPQIAPLQIADIAGGSLMMAMSILGACIKKLKGEGGSYIDCSITHQTFTLLPFLISLINESSELTKGFLTGANPCYSIYTAKNGKKIGFAPLEPKFWFSFCQKIGREDLLSLSPVIEEESNLLRKNLTELFLTEDSGYWENIGLEADCCISSLYPIEDSIDFTNEENYHTIISKEFQGKTVNYMLTNPLINAPNESIMISPAPEHGEHTDSILKNLLKIEDQEIQKLKKEDIIL